jgi:hypothetical protein
MNAPDARAGVRAAVRAALLALAGCGGGSGQKPALVAPKL